MENYSVNREIKKILSKIIDDTGQITDFGCIDKLNMTRLQKAENIGHAFFILSSELENTDFEINSLSARKVRIKNEMEALKQIMDYIAQGEKLNSDTVAVSYKKSDCLILDEAVLPKRYFVKTVILKPNKPLIKEQLKNGKAIDGCSFEYKNNIIIKEI